MLQEVISNGRKLDACQTLPDLSTLLAWTHYSPNLRVYEHTVYTWSSTTF